MKPLSLFVFALSFLFASCASDAPSGPPPFMGILSARKIGNGPRATSQYQVKVHYENIEPEKYEIKVGFGYVPSDENLSKMVASASGIYAIAHSEVVHQQSGDMVLTIDPSAARALGALDGKVHAILSKYPHGKEWIIARHDVFALDPE